MNASRSAHLALGVVIAMVLLAGAVAAMRDTGAVAPADGALVELAGTATVSGACSHVSAAWSRTTRGGSSGSG